MDRSSALHCAWTWGAARTRQPTKNGFVVKNRRPISREVVEWPCGRQCDFSIGDAVPLSATHPWNAVNPRMPACVVRLARRAVLPLAQTPQRCTARKTAHVLTYVTRFEVRSKRFEGLRSTSTWLHFVGTRPFICHCPQHGGSAAAAATPSPSSHRRRRRTVAVVASLPLSAIDRNDGATTTTNKQRQRRRKKHQTTNNGGGKCSGFL